MFTDQFGREHRYGPPANYVRPPAGVQINFSADEDWQRLCARGLQFEPYSGPSRIYGVRGDCMEPLLIAGKHMLHVRPHAPDEPLIDGGMYCIEWNEADAELLPAYKERQGIPATEKIVITKFLRWMHGDWWSQCKDSVAHLNGVVVGMVVGVTALSAAAGCGPVDAPAVHARQPCGNPFGPESAECAQVGLNAASQIYALYAAAPAIADFGNSVNLVNSTLAGSALTVNMSGTYPVAIDLQFTFGITIPTGCTSWGVTFGIARGVSNPPISGTAVFHIDSTKADWSVGSRLTWTVTLSVVDPSPVAGSATYYLTETTTGTSPSGPMGSTFTQMSMKIREIKR